MTQTKIQAATAAVVRARDTVAEIAARMPVVEMQATPERRTEVMDAVQQADAALRRARAAVCQALWPEDGTV